MSSAHQQVRAIYFPRPFVVVGAGVLVVGPAQQCMGPLKNNGRACMRSCSMVAGIAARFFNLVRAGGRGGAGVRLMGPGRDQLLRILLHPHL